MLSYRYDAVRYEVAMSDKIVHNFITKSGLRVEVLPLEADDAPQLIDLFHHMSPDSRYFRFNQSLNEPDPDLLQRGALQLADIDPQQEGGWLARADLPDQPGAPVAAVRYVRTGDETAEAALSVRDDMQNQGIGTELLRFLAGEARAQGIKTITGTIQAGNQKLWHILKQIPLPYRRKFESGYVYIEVDLT